MSEHFDSRRPRRRFISCRPATVPAWSSLRLRLFHHFIIYRCLHPVYSCSSLLCPPSILMLCRWAASVQRRAASATTTDEPPRVACSLPQSAATPSDQFRCVSFIEFVVVAGVPGAPERARAPRCRSIRCPCGVRAFDLSIAFVPHLQPSSAPFSCLPIHSFANDLRPPSLSVAPRCSRRWREKIHSLACALLTPSPANYLIYTHANYLELRCCKPPCGLRTVLPPPLARSTDGDHAMRCDAIADSFVGFSFSWCVSATHTSSPVFLFCCFGPLFAGVPLVIRLSLLLYRPRSFRLSPTRLSRPCDADPTLTFCISFCCLPFPPPHEHRVAPSLSWKRRRHQYASRVSPTILHFR